MSVFLVLRLGECHLDVPMHETVTGVSVIKTAQLRNRYCWRCRCTWYCTATEAICRHDFDLDFRRSLR